MFDATLLSFLVEKLQHVSSGLVYGLVVALVFGEAALFVGFVFPGETAVIVAGFAASQGRVNIVILIVLVVVAAIVGDSVGYEVGQRWGRRLIDLPIIRSRHSAIERALEGLERRGPIYVFIGRFTAFLRAIMPGLAGMSKLRYRRFLLANAAGGIIWGVGYCLLGYFGGDALTSIERASGWATGSLLVLVLLAVVVLHYRRRRRERRDDASWRGEHPGTASAKDTQ